MTATRQPGDSQAQKNSVVCLTKYIPYPGISHAGGEYLESHARVIGTFARINFFAPATPLNVDALTRVRSDTSASMLGARPLRGLWFRFLQIEATLAGSSMYAPIRRLFRGSKAPWAELSAADIVEFQWGEMIALAPLVRKQLPVSTLVGVAHDINTQRWTRKARQSRGLRRVLARLIAGKTQHQESRSFSALDVLIVFSEKDAALARELAPGLRVEIVHPGFVPKSVRRKPSVSAPVVLFVGAMNRPENEDAVLWFLEQVWPRISQAVPAAKFVIAGAKPSQRLSDVASTAQSVELTGFVETLTPWYEQAAVCVVPLRTGAGVKFKTIDAMISGVPVVTTSVGAEGIDATNLFSGLTDEADQFADAVIEELRTPDTVRTELAREWAETNYGLNAFNARLRELYGGLFNA